jgi:hypothetical protein
MKDIVKNEKLIAYCGLYCGACKKYLKGKCPGCEKYVKAKWCKIRSCCVENKYLSCANCKIMPTNECKKFNNFLAKLISSIFRSDRHANINFIKTNGYSKYAEEMSEQKLMSIKK